MKHSNLNRIFHALKKHHGRSLSRRQLKRHAVDTVKNYPWFHRFRNGVDMAPWLDGTPSAPAKWD